MHQLAAPGAVRPRVVAGLPGRRADRHRRPHAGVLLRARHRPRAAGDRGASDRLPGRRRQRLRDLERVRQPLLAGAVLRRHATASSATSTSAKDATSNRSASSSSCSASSASPSRSKGSAWRRRPTGTTCARPRPISATGAAASSRLRSGAALDERRAYELPERPAPQPLGARRRVDDRAPRTSCSTRPAGPSPSGSTRATRTSCCLRQRASRSRSACSSTASLPARRTASTSTRTATACCADGRMYQLVRQHDAVRDADAGDHVPRARRRGVRVHVRLAPPVGPVGAAPRIDRGAAPHRIDYLQASPNWRLPITSQPLVKTSSLTPGPACCVYDCTIVP